MRRGRRIYTCVRFFDEKDFRIGYTCVSSLIAPLEGSSLLPIARKGNEDAQIRIEKHPLAALCEVVMGRS